VNFDDRVCLGCGQRFRPHSGSHVYCEPACRPRRVRVYDYVAKSKARHLAEPELAIECPVCGQRFHRLVGHLSARHGMTLAEFHAAFPEVPTVSLHISLIARDLARDREWQREWAREEVLRALQHDARRRGYAPGADDWTRATKQRPQRSTVIRLFGSWNKALIAAGLPTRRPSVSRPRWGRERLIRALHRDVSALGRVPTQQEWSHPGRWRPTHMPVRREFGSWNAFIVAAGYEPRRRGQNLL
jgi:hypothetical protein